MCLLESYAISLDVIESCRVSHETFKSVFFSLKIYIILLVLLPLSLGILFFVVFMLINPMDVVVLKVFPVVDLGQWWSVVRPIG